MTEDYGKLAGPVSGPDVPGVGPRRARCRAPTCQVSGPDVPGVGARDRPVGTRVSGPEVPGVGARDRRARARGRG